MQLPLTGPIVIKKHLLPVAYRHSVLLLLSQLHPDVCGVILPRNKILNPVEYNIYSVQKKFTLVCSVNSIADGTCRQICSKERFENVCKAYASYGIILHELGCSKIQVEWVQNSSFRPNIDLFIQLGAGGRLFYFVTSLQHRTRTHDG